MLSFLIEGGTTTVQVPVTVTVPVTRSSPIETLYTTICSTNGNSDTGTTSTTETTSVTTSESQVMVTSTYTTNGQVVTTSSTTTTLVTETITGVTTASPHSNTAAIAGGVGGGLGASLLLVFFGCWIVYVPQQFPSSERADHVQSQKASPYRRRGSDLPAEWHV